MTLGEKLKQLRVTEGLSQPELAERIGIEQSYLSKLENDKSVPSNEMFTSLLSAFEMSVDELLASLSSEDLARLKQIPQVGQWLTQKSNDSYAKHRRFLYMASAMIVLATTLFYVGFSKILFNETQYEYESLGIVQLGEPKNVHSSWRDLIDFSKEGAHTLVRTKKAEMAKRRDQVVVISAAYRGPSFEEAVEGGTRFYKLDKKITLPKPINAWLQILGVFLMLGGVMGFVLEKKLFGNN